MYFNNIGKLDLKFIEYALQPRHQKPLDESEVKEISESFDPLEYFPNLSSLKLSLTDSTSLEVASPQIVNKKYLTDLDLRSNLMTIKCLKKILTEPEIYMNLNRLDVSVNVLTNIEMITLCSHLSNLKHLNISHNKIFSFDIQNGCVFRDTLEELYVSDCNLWIDSLKTILMSYPNLTVLDFSFNSVRKIKNLYNSIIEENNVDQYCKLVKLNFSGCQVTNEITEYIAKMPIFSELTTLDLSRNRINKLGTETLSNESFSVLSKIEFLDLSRCGIGKIGAQNIRQSSIFSALKTFIE